MTTHPTPEQVSAAFVTLRDSKYDHEADRDKWDFHHAVSWEDEYDAAIATLRAHIERQDAVIESLRPVAKRWWWRTQETGTLCTVCGASTHFDLGIDDIIHRDGCAVPAYLAALRGDGE